jgi:hypothetical protein
MFFLHVLNRCELPKQKCVSKVNVEKYYQNISWSPSYYLDENMAISLKTAVQFLVIMSGITGPNFKEVTSWHIRITLHIWRRTTRASKNRIFGPKILHIHAVA